MEEQIKLNQIAVLARVDNIPTLSAEAVEDRVEVNGQSITRASLLSMVQNPIQEMQASWVLGMEDLHSQMRGIRADQILIQTSGPSRAGAGAGPETDFEPGTRLLSRPHRWGPNGAYHPIPQDYEFLPYNVEVHWNYWHFGDTQNNIGPHKWIDHQKDLYCFPPMIKKLFSAVKQVILKIIDLLPLQYKPITRINSDSGFTYGYKLLIQLVYTNIPTRYTDKQITTVYENLLKYNKKIRDSNRDNRD